ncbi:MAG: trypsin-like peptidase domain-containing protein [bacterium]
MSLYDLPKIDLPSKDSLEKGLKKIETAKVLTQKNPSHFIILNIFVSILFGFLGAAIFAGYYFYPEARNNFIGQFFPATANYIPQTSQEAAVIKTVEEASPSVVSIIITKTTTGDSFEDFHRFFGEGFFEAEPREEEIGSGTGFIISRDGIVLTNKHVVSDQDADYTVLINQGEKFSAKVLARDPFKDLAVLKIESEREFEPIKLGDSDDLQIGQSVIAIGNALGEFSNTISVGVVSGLRREVVASGGGITEKLENLIQTDAAINRGNSGGPLLNLKGEVIGVNTAMSSDGQNIGFSIPINDAKKDIEMIKEKGEIIYPFLGVRYFIINPAIQKEKGLSVDYGALVADGKGSADVAVTPGSAAEKAGLKEGDIILKFNNEKITIDNSLAEIIQKYNPGDKIVLKILRGEKEIIMETILGERSS